MKASRSPCHLAGKKVPLTAFPCIMLAGRGENRDDNVHSARLGMEDVQLSLRLLNDLKVLPDKRHTYFIEIVQQCLYGHL